MQPPPANVNVASRLIEERSEDTKELIKVMKDTTLWSPFDRTNSDPFFDYLDKYKEKSKGWIRKVLPEDFRTDKQSLTNKERMILITMYNLFSGFSKSHGKFKGWQKLLCNAWGVSKISMIAIVYNYYDSGFHEEKKERKDKGQTLINSEKRKSTYTPLYVFKREQTQRRYRNHTHRLNDTELNSESDSITNYAKRYIQILSKI